MFEMTFALGAIAALLAIPVGLVILAVRSVRQGRRIATLEAALAALDRPADPTRRPIAAPTAPEATVAAPNPWTTPPPPEPVPAEASTPSPSPEPPQPQPPGVLARGAAWLAANWFLAAAAASLALAGIFLVQYGAERGVFPPVVRVGTALAFAAALIIAGEVVRRRYGDAPESGATLTLGIPSVLSGAGIVTANGAVLGAIHLYGLIGPLAGLAAIVAISLLSVVLGWFHGPVLVATGLIGGALSPFVVGGGGEDLSLLHGYYAALALLGLAIDAVRRWPGRWVSWLALGAGLGGSILVHAADPDSAPAHAVAIGVITLLALTFPAGRSVPAHPGRMVTEWLTRRRMPEPSTLMAAATIAIGSLVAYGLARQDVLLGAGLAAALFLAISLFARHARALQDQALPPVAALLAMAPLAWARTPEPLEPNVVPEGLPEGAFVILALLAVSALVSVVAFLRSRDPAPTWSTPWALGAVITFPAMGLLLHVTANAPAILGAYPWALIAMAAAAALTGAAALWARAGARRSAAIAGLMATTLIGYGLGWLIGDTALTVAVAGLAFGAAWLARRLSLPELGWFVILAAPFVTWRLAANPGLVWHIETGPILEVSAAMALPAILFWLARGQLTGLRRPASAAADVAEMAALGVAGFTLTAWLIRGMEALDIDTGHATAGLIATIWFVLAASQLELVRRRSGLRRPRLAVAALFGVLGLGALVIGATLISPLVGFFGQPVAGPPVFNTLIPAYLVPAVALLAMGRRFGSRILTGAGLATAAYWGILAIRHAIRGASEMSIDDGIASSEMVVYTVALIVLGAVLFWQGLARGAPTLRRAGTLVLGATVAKVFLVDAAALGGLFRVTAFLALGLALIGLTWVDRWASARAAAVRGDDSTDDG
ncbi:DUF2339 domain-containing protein [Jannaschia sp. KMU-145]|uniref:DUF2339 domain-containing protein n=1 Tax=Jannaschia halovivens TaxID=3388667 RepID=UPI00396B1F31